jgi:hypothetical protein
MASGIVFGQASANKILKRPKTAALSNMQSGLFGG